MTEILPIYNKVTQLYAGRDLREIDLDNDSLLSYIVSTIDDGLNDEDSNQSGRSIAAACLRSDIDLINSIIDVLEDESDE